MSGKPKGGRWPPLNAFVDESLADRTRAELAVWLVLFRDARCGNYKGVPGMYARVGQADIAQRGGLSARSVKLAVAGLSAAGMLKVVRRGRLNVGPSVYSVRGRAP